MSSETCGFCGTDQPAAAAAVAKETRCATCKRPYAAKLVSCPFCARDRAAGIAPTPFGPTISLSPPVFEEENETDDDGDPRPFRNAALFGVPLLLGALWGAWQTFHLTRLGGAELSGPWRPALVLALFSAPLVAVGFVRRSYRTLDGAVERIGVTKAILVGLTAAIVAYVPAVFTFAGLLSFFNGLGIETREETVDCKVGSIWHRLHEGTDMGWHVSYWCDVRGDHLTGSVERLPARPDFTEGGMVRVRAARGRLGYWIRLGEPTGTPRAP